MGGAITAGVGSGVIVREGEISGAAERRLAGESFLLGAAGGVNLRASGRGAGTIFSGLVFGADTAGAGTAGVAIGRCGWLATFGFGAGSLVTAGIVAAAGAGWTAAVSGTLGLRRTLTAKTDPKNIAVTAAPFQNCSERRASWTTCGDTETGAAGAGAAATSTFGAAGITTGTAASCTCRIGAGAAGISGASGGSSAPNSFKFTGNSTVERSG